jgi:5-formyltetrahydrofolate cyclo-ligase
MDTPKSLLRKEVRLALAEISDAERQRLSHSLCEAFRTVPIWNASSTVLLFAPLKNEPDIAPLIDEALMKGKTVALPRFDAERGRYTPCEVRSRLNLATGPFGVLEPDPQSPVFSAKQLDIILVPGIAFDLTGRRLGRGKGHYDRLLAEVSGHKCGVCFDAQVVPSVPEEPHDIRLNSILTPTRWLPCQPAV